MENTASEVWADTAYCSAANEAYLEKCGRRSRIHHKKPKGRPMPEPLSRGNATKSKIRARVEHVFAEQKDRMDRVPIYYLFLTIDRKTALFSAPMSESLSFALR
jgi:IS5 family transposase